MTLTTKICDVEPFRYQATAQPLGEENASANQINEQYLEDYLSRMRVALCADIENIIAEIDDLVVPTSFLQLTDTPDSYAGAAGDHVAVKATEDGLEFVPVTDPSFLDLTDTPNSYTGSANLPVVVKADESGLEFGAFPTPPPQSTYKLTPRLIALWPPNITAGFIGPAPATVGGGQVQIPVNPANALAANYRQQLTSGTGANAQAGVRTVVFQAIVGSAAPMGGFRLFYRFGWESVHTGQRGFVGFSPNAAAFPTAASDPSALTNILAMAFDAADANWQIMHNDAAGTATKINLGANFAINTTDLLELILDVTPSAGTVTYRVKNLSTGNEATNTISTNLPAGGQPLGLCACSNAAASGVAARITHIFMSLEVGPGME